VMVVCQAGDISFWSLEGQKTKRFSEPDAGETLDTTCLGFDEFGEKFYTGGSDGKIRVIFVSFQNKKSMNLKYRFGIIMVEFYKYYMLEVVQR